MMNKKRVVIIILILVLSIFLIRIGSANLTKENSSELLIEALEEFLGEYLGKEIEIKYIKTFYVVKETGEEVELVLEVG